MQEFKLSKDASIFLDLVRSVSAQMVLLGHLLIFLKIYPGANNEKTHALYIQNFGVLAFFILSGFLISYSTKRKVAIGGFKFKNYFFDRFIRIYSAFIPCLFFILFVDVVSFSLFPAEYSYDETFNLKTFLLNVFMLQDYPMIDFRSIFSGNISVATLLNFNLISQPFASGRPLWTLALEWWFYLFFGFLVLHKTIKLNSVLKFFIFLVLAFIPLLNTTFMRGSCLTYVWFMGVLMYFAVSSPLMKSIYNSKILIGAFIFLALLRVFTNKNEAYDFQLALILTIIFALLLNFYSNSSVFNNQTVNTWIRTSANYSFTLYLIHYSIIDFAKNYINEGQSFMGLGALFIICNVLAFSIAYYTEFRHKEFREFFHSRYAV